MTHLAALPADFAAATDLEIWEIYRNRMQGYGWGFMPFDEWVAGGNAPRARQNLQDVRDLRIQRGEPA